MFMGDKGDYYGFKMRIIPKDSRRDSFAPEMYTYVSVTGHGHKVIENQDVYPCEKRPKEAIIKFPMKTESPSPLS